MTSCAFSSTRTLDEKTTRTVAYRNKNSTRLIGAAKRIQVKNEMLTPRISSSIPMPIRFGGVPTGVAMPPMLHENAIINSSAIEYLPCPSASPRPAGSVRNTPRPIGSIIAVVAVLEIHIDKNQAMAPNASRILHGWLPTQGRDRTNSAIRRSRPCCIIPRAIRNEPRNRNKIGCPNEANASRTGATPRGTASAGPSSAVAARGIASVTQKTMTRAKIAASRCAPGSRPVGAASTVANSRGPSSRPIVRRVQTIAAMYRPTAVHGSIKRGSYFDKLEAPG